MVVGNSCESLKGDLRSRSSRESQYLLAVRREWKNDEGKAHQIVVSIFFSIIPIRPQYIPYHPYITHHSRGVIQPRVKGLGSKTQTTLGIEGLGFTV